MSKKILLGRYRNTEYVVNYENSKWTFAGSKDDKIHKIGIPEEAVEYLQMHTSCFTDGELAIITENEEGKEYVEGLLGKEEYENNIHTRDEIIKILESNINKMKSELKKITNVDEKKFVLETAKEINLDSSAKRTFIAEWIETQLSADELFQI